MFEIAGGIGLILGFWAGWVFGSASGRKEIMKRYSAMVGLDLAKPGTATMFLVDTKESEARFYCGGGDDVFCRTDDGNCPATKRERPPRSGKGLAESGEGFAENRISQRAG